MIGLVFADLRHHGRVWFGALISVLAAGFVGGFAAGLLETSTRYDGPAAEALTSSSMAVIVFSAIAALVVLSSAAALTVALQSRGYALWQLVGVSPSRVGLVVLAQLAVIGVVGSLLGCLVAVATFTHIFDWVFRDWQGLQSVEPSLGFIGALATVVTVTVVVVAAGLRGARRASRVAPIAALRDPEPTRLRIGWVRATLIIGVTWGAVAMISGFTDASFSTISSQAILLAPLIVAIFAGLGPVLFPLVLRAWTAVIPARLSASWFLARHSARARLSQSSATISPLMVAIALAGGLYTTAETLAVADALRTGGTASYDLAVEGVVLLLGGPLLLSAIGAAASVFMTGHSREHEFALVRAAGSTHATIIMTAVWEAVIYTVTAAMLGLIAVLITGFALARAVDLDSPVVSFAALGLITGGGFALILAATVIPTVAALRHEIPRTLAVE